MKNTEVIIGIVVKTDKVKEADVRVRILTAAGLKTVTAVGALKPNAKLKSAVQLFTIAEFSVIGHKLVGAHVLQTNHNITKDIKRFYLACAICEVVAQCHGAGFLLTARVLEALDHLGEDHSVTPAACHRGIFTEYFSKLLMELGYDIESDVDLNTAYMRYLDIKIPNTKYFL